MGLATLLPERHQITFRFYPTATKGSAFGGMERIKEVAIVNGKADCALGDDSTPSNMHFNSSELEQLRSNSTFVGVSLDDGSELEPRFLITGRPYMRQLILKLRMAEMPKGKAALGVHCCTPSPEDIELLHLLNPSLTLEEISEILRLSCLYALRGE
jgi:hypothetical protein